MRLSGALLLAAIGCGGGHMVTDAGPSDDAGGPPVVDAVADAADGETAPPAITCAAPDEAPFALSNLEYNLTVRDLLGDLSAPGNGFPPDQTLVGFRAGVPLSPDRIAAFTQAADALAQAATVQRLASVLPCDPKIAGEEACAQQFIVAFGARAYRRPLIAGEISALHDVYAAGRQTGDFAAGIAAVIAEALKSPHFYQLEVDQTPGRPALLTGYEMASRLSYFLYRSMPDDALFAAAQDGQLATAGQVAAQVPRLLANDKSSDAVNAFFEQWLNLDGLDTLAAAPAVSADDAALYTAMKIETATFAQSIFFSRHPWTNFLTSNQTWLNESLADLYGVPDIVGPEFRAAAVAADARAGFVTQGSLLVLTSTGPATLPTQRAGYLAEKFLCASRLLIPVGHSDELLPNAGESRRQALARVTAVADCSSCHQPLDPLGWPLERFDVMGRARSTDDSGAPIDPSAVISANLLDTTGNPTAVNDAVALAGALAQSTAVADCLGQTLFRFAVRRPPQELGSLTAQCRPDGLTPGTTKDSDFEQLIVALVTSDDFRSVGGCLPCAVSSGGSAQ
ncbi:MAG TPA: DUF1592 domain-containing protein [Polyangia bacterium]